MSQDYCAWVKPIFHSSEPMAAWQSLFEMLGTLSQASTSPEELRKQTIAPDRLLAESAWDLRVSARKSVAFYAIEVTQMLIPEAYSCYP